MKFFVLALTLFTALPQSFADFVPGRVRQSAVAEMEIREATGSFAGARKAQLIQHVQDDKGIVAYTLDVDGRTLKFTVKKFKPTGCGDVTTAEYVQDATGALRANLRLTDMSRALCEIVVNRLWQAEITAKDAQERSRLVIEGNPEYLVHTL